jgi:hypothetical protein
VHERICKAELELHPAYLKAVCVLPLDLPAAEPGEICDLLSCVLAAGHQGRHHGLARSLPMGHDSEVWACWDSGQQPAALIAVPDCPVVAPHDRDEACVLFNGHAGAHSWALSDPDEDAVRARLGLVPPQPSVATETARSHPATRQTCRHPSTEKRDGKIHCARCKRQLYL